MSNPCSATRSATLARSGRLFLACSVLVAMPLAAQSSGGAIARTSGAKPPLLQAPVQKAEGDPAPPPPPPPIRTSRCAVDAHMFANSSCGDGDPCDLGAAPPCRPLVGGLGLAAAGVGLRHTPNGTLSVRGVPEGSSVVWAVLLWSQIAKDPTAEETRHIQFENHDVVGKKITDAPEPCWLDDDTIRMTTYASDVTELLGDRANGDFRVAKDGGARQNWSDPWNEPLGTRPRLADGSELDGAALLVFYDDPHRARGAKVHVWLGQDRVDDTALFDLRFEPALGPTTSASFLQVIADGQQRRQDGPVLRYATVLINGLSYTVVQGPTSPHDLYGTGSGNEGGAITQLWDVENTRIDATAVKLNVGTDRLTLAYAALDHEAPPRELEIYDCINPVLLALASEPAPD